MARKQIRYDDARNALLHAGWVPLVKVLQTQHWVRGALRCVTVGRSGVLAEHYYVRFSRRGRFIVATHVTE